jgi:pimeloyl-ACP methyl ester carboxylesterase
LAAEWARGRAGLGVATTWARRRAAAGLPGGRQHTVDVKRAVVATVESLHVRADLVSPWPGRPVLIDGSYTHVRETPASAVDAEPALYVHGLGGSAQNWTDVAGMLDHRLAGQAIDLPGFGRSDPAERYTVDAFAHRVVRCIEAADRGPVHLIGNSLGGAIAVKVAAVRPDLVRTLTLISPALPFLDPRRSAQGRMLPLLAVPRAERLAQRRLSQIRPEVLAQQVLEACWGDPAGIHPRRVAEAVKEIELRYDVPWYADAYVRTLRGLVGSFLRAYLPGSSSLWRTAARVNKPTLVIGGQLDRLVDVRVAPHTARVIRDARLLMLPGVGHVAQMEAPELVAGAIVGMLDEVRTPPLAGRAA